ncbi:MAG TPA: hypothetical protein O0X74_05155 [Methanocorpusculum sp.]|jgi:hypothetical protein|nr:hypothetical protein [Methanocorpusculum sp.]
MRLQGSIQHKACADGSYMKEYQIDEPLSKEFFDYLKHFGRVTSLEEMGDGYYSFEKPNWFSIKGFAGDQTVEVRFKRETMEITTDFLYLLFSFFKDGADIAYLKEKEKFREKRIAELLGK